ncbi:hypothetical protein, partial [Nocardiopsis suaedae]
MRRQYGRTGAGRLGWCPADGPWPGGGWPGCGVEGGDDEGGWAYLVRCRPPGARMVTAVGGDGESGVVPRACLPGGGFLAVRVGGSAGAPLTGPG